MLSSEKVPQAVESVEKARISMRSNGPQKQVSEKGRYSCMMSLVLSKSLW